MKCLGKINYPRVRVTEFSFREGLATLRFESGEKYVTVVMGVDQARILVDRAREIVGLYDDQVKIARDRCDRLAEYVGYKEQP